jgi:Lipase maturation factor
VSIILTANYTFLNYLVLSLGVLLLDDRFILRITPKRWREMLSTRTASPPHEPALQRSDSDTPPAIAARTPKHPHVAALKLALISVMLLWIFYATTAQLLWMFFPRLPLPSSPVAALDPFRIANRYGLFAVMTRGRYEIEFQGSNDGQQWTAYPFRYKPQALNQPPGIYAPYQPRLDWNLWFASLGFWREYPIVISTEERLLAANKDVLALFAGNPFSSAPPRQVRAVLWQYWFTTMAEKRATGDWWKRKYLGIYAPVLEREPDGKLGVVEWPTPLPPRQ